MDIRKIDRFCGMVLPQTLGNRLILGYGIISVLLF